MGRGKAATSKAGTPPYRGTDRRVTSDWHGPSLGPFVGAGAGLLLVVLIFAVGPSVSDASNLFNVSLFSVQLDAAAVAVGVLAGMLCITRWRVTGEAAALWLGLALLVFSLVTIGLGILLPTAQPVGFDQEFVALLHPASRVAVLWLIWRAFRSPEVDAGLRIWTALLAAAGVTGAFTVAFYVMPGLLSLLAGAGDVLGGSAGAATGTGVLVAAWIGLGAVSSVRGIRTRHWLFAWLGLAFLALAFAEFLKVSQHAVGSLWIAGPNLLRFLAIILAVVGATRELVRAFEEQRVRLLKTVESDMHKEARLEAEQRAFEEMAHEARNALTAIEGATKTLERYRDRLDDGTRATLTEAVSHEIARLQTLVSVDRMRSNAGAFRLSDVVAAIVTATRSHDVTVHVDVPDDFSAYGQPGETGQVVQNLVVNARRYAPGSPVYLRAEATQSGVILRVEDEGPGVPATERRAIFERGRRGSAAGKTDGSGLGLYVSARLMREQGGDLWVEERAGGGASFALWLPSEEASAQVLEQVGDKTDQPVQGAQVTPLFRVRVPEYANGDLAGEVREHDHHVRDYLSR